MGRDSKIEWTHHTFNPWRGCTKVSDGCKHCYALDLSKRNPAALGVWGPKGTRVIAAESYWKQPIKWNREAEAAGERRRVFCASLADVFEGPETMPAEAWGPIEIARERLSHLIERTPHLDWLLLTKRPQNIRHMAPPWWYQEGWPPNVWIGTSVEDQAAADERIPHLLRVPARVRFLSCEPLLGPVDISPYLDPVGSACCGGEQCPCLGDWPWDDVRSERARIHWVIAGGESGPKARPMHPAWARSLRDQCEAAGVAFHFKQHGEYVAANGDATAPDGARYGGGDDPNGRDLIALPDGSITGVDWNGGPGPHLRGGVQLLRLGKHTAGRLLDGREWDEMPGMLNED